MPCSSRKRRTRATSRAANAALAAEIAANSRQALAAGKQLYRTGADLPLGSGLAHEAAARFDISDTDERLGGFR